MRMRLRSERGHEKHLTDIVETIVGASDNALFKLSISITGTTYQKNTFISHEVAEMALRRALNNTIMRIAELEVELKGPH